MAVRRFAERVRELPRLGLGVSTEYGAGAAAGALDVAALRAGWPQFAQFLEVGVEVVKGLDGPAQAWTRAGLPTTYHFLDVNLDEPVDLEPGWLAEVGALARGMRAAWLCGDAGWWHFAARDRGHMLLLPPVLTRESADAMADGLMRVRDATGLEVLPENPPGQVFVGDLGLLEFFARVCERADTGMLLDCAHLAIYQRVMGRDALAGLEGFPLERVVELHVAGGSLREVAGWQFVEDDHVPAVLPETWRIFERVAPRAGNLKAVVFECERNPVAACLEGFERIAGVWR
ncbi:MAG: DUF692 family protein [Deltaproteobacteria bacterium]|nr:DUF692 family protein [Deltaproteobacteria bacterium]